MGNLLKKIFGTSSQRKLKEIEPLVKKIEALEEPYKALTDEELQAKTDEFKARLKNGETTDDILPEAFAVCREASWRVLGMRPYRVQLIGGIILHQGRIAEMKPARQDPGGHPARIPQRPYRRGRPHRDGQRLPGQARQRVDGQGLPLPGPDRGPGHPRGVPRPSATPPMPPISLTAPTTSSASTICGTTWPFTSRRWSSGAMPSPSWTRWTPSSSTRPVPPLIISGQGDQSTQLYQIVDSFVSA